MNNIKINHTRIIDSVYYAPGESISAGYVVTGETSFTEENGEAGIVKWNMINYSNTASDVLKLGYIGLESGLGEMFIWEAYGESPCYDYKGDTFKRKVLTKWRNLKKAGLTEQANALITKDIENHAAMNNVELLPNFNKDLSINYVYERDIIQNTWKVLFSKVLDLQYWVPDDMDSFLPYINASVCGETYLVGIDNETLTVEWQINSNTDESVESSIKSLFNKAPDLNGSQTQTQKILVSNNGLTNIDPRQIDASNGISNHEAFVSTENIYQIQESAMAAIKKLENITLESLVKETDCFRDKRNNYYTCRIMDLGRIDL